MKAASALTAASSFSVGGRSLAAMASSWAAMAPNVFRSSVR